jgi:cytidine deaminase
MIDERFLSPKEQEALAAARAAQTRAYAPYSGKHVGAAIITDSGAIFAACNMENESSDLWVCAERNAIASAIARGERKFHTVFVIAPDGRYWPPCHLCRRVIAEFAPNAEIIMCNGSGTIHRATLESLGAIPFGADGSGEHE